MSERTKLLKKAVLTGVGATTNAERIKQALESAVDDLVKVGQDLIDDLESKGKVKTESMQSFLKNLQDEATKRTSNIEKKVSKQVSTSMKKVARELGLITREEYEDLIERIAALEDALPCSEEEGAEGKKSRSTRSRKSHS